MKPKPKIHRTTALRRHEAIGTRTLTPIRFKEPIQMGAFYFKKGATIELEIVYRGQSWRGQFIHVIIPPGRVARLWEDEASWETPPRKYFAVVGRVLHDTEDTCSAIQAESANAAVTEFRKQMHEDRNDIESDEEIIVNHVISSDWPLEIETYT